MSEVKEPLVTLALIVVMLLFEVNPRQSSFLIQMPDKSCTSIKGMEIKQWFTFLFYHHVDKRHLAYNVLLIFWKGVLLEGCVGSRQFSLLVLALLFIYHGMMILTGLLWQLLAKADICLSICQIGISGLPFAFSFLVNTHSEVYKSIIPVSSQPFCKVTVSAICVMEFVVLYWLCPVLPFHGPVCGTLSGFLYSHRTPIFSKWDSWLFIGRSCLHQLLKIIRTTDSEQLTETINMAWSCRACTYENLATVNPYACAICETPRYDMIGSHDLHVNPENTGLVWNCPACTFDNGVFLHGCEICGTPRPVLV